MLVGLKDISKSYWDRPIFTGLTLHVKQGDRIGIIGANGSGKSTLLRIVAGQVEPDDGERTAVKDLRSAYVEQEPAFEPGSTVTDALMSVLSENAVSPVESEVDHQVRAQRMLTKLGFSNPDQAVATLSGGWHKRLAVAQAMVTEPDLLLLDEPTNHLDLEGIFWLEKVLAQARFAYIVISHDRAFLEKAAATVIELDKRHPGGILRVDGPYSVFLERREQYLAGRAKAVDGLSSRVETEIAWLRSGVKARTTKARGRIQEAHRLREELENMRGQEKTLSTNIDFASSGRKTKRLLVAHQLSKVLGGRKLFANLSILLRPGLKMGLVGANGSGKTTLLKTLAGLIQPDSGTLKPAPNLEMVYFDQKREALDGEVSLRRTLCPEGDKVIFRERPIHVASWAQRFGFRPDQLDVPVGRLSGGEHAKVFISRLVQRKADVLLLDEPTNDLDIATLEVLEQSLLDFPGAVVIVTHDRYILDKISTVLIGLDGSGGAEYYGDFEQWWEYQASVKEPNSPEKNRSESKPKPKSTQKKLSYKDQIEYDGMEAAIQKAEAEFARAQADLENPEFASDAARLEKAFADHQVAREKVDALYSRWAELEEMVENLNS